MRRRSVSSASRPTSRWPRGLTIAVALALAGCPGKPCRSAAEPLACDGAGGAGRVRELLDVDAASLSRTPATLARIQSSPFAYFRYVTGPFSRAVCEHYRDKNAHMPTVRLHGDAHVEQYAVADDGFGIVDFDDATQGPPTIDWVRFASSLWITARFDEAASRGAIQRFLVGYRTGLSNPAAVLSAPEPAAATRLRKKTKGTALEWLDQVTALMKPPDDVSLEMMNQARARYVTSMLVQNPDLGRDYFALKKGGLLEMGIGSAHETKFLVRVEGPSAAAEDDVILEKKQMKDHIFGQCNRSVGEGRLDPARVVEAQKKFSRTPQRLIGYVEVEGKTFYVHAWRVRYRELSLEDVHGPEELAELAFDVGLQLGRGHPLLPATTDAGRAERAAITATLADLEPGLADVSKALAVRTQCAYERFRSSP